MKTIVFFVMSVVCLIAASVFGIAALDPCYGGGCGFIDVRGIYLYIFLFSSVIGVTLLTMALRSHRTVPIIPSTLTVKKKSSHPFYLIISGFGFLLFPYFSGTFFVSRGFSIPFYIIIGFPLGAILLVVGLIKFFSQRLKL
jgi:hypothetical protein